MQSVRTPFCAALATLALACTASAQTAEDLAGNWKRTGGMESPSIGVYQLDVGGQGLTGSMVNPPEGFACELDLALNGQELAGTATWKETAVDMRVETRWELTVVDAKTLSGRCQWKVWAHDGTIEDEGWDDYELVKVQRVGLAVDGEGAEAPFGDPLPAPGEVFGGYAALGQGWTIRHQLGTWKVEPAAGGPFEGTRIELREAGGILSGQVTLADGATCKLELGWNADEQTLSGRSSWTEGDDEGWAPITFTRLERINAGPIGLAEFPRAGDEGTIAGVYKRDDDGVYLRLEGDESNVSGDLVDAEGNVQARVELRNANGIWRGTSNHDGVEVKWEYSKTGAGLTGRAEFIDVMDGKVITRAFSPRSYTALKRLD